jgi:hypothetical protein
MINNSIRNKGNTFPLEIKGLFYTRIISNFPQEMLGYVSNGNSVKHYIIGNFKNPLVSREQLK